MRKRVFISFAIEDEKYRDFLVGQARNSKSPFDLIDMSVKQPWNEREWKEKCRIKIKSCDGMLVLLSNNTIKSAGAKWEIKCATEEKIPVMGVFVKRDETECVPPQLKGKVIKWTWDNLAGVIKRFKKGK